MLTNSTPSLRAPNIAHNSGPKLKLRHAKLSHHIPPHKSFLNCNGSRRTPHTVARGPDHPQSLGPSEEHRALETVLKLYEAIKHKNVHLLSDIIAEECSCISNFVSAFQPFLGKKQVMAFFSSLMKYMGNNIEFVVQQTLDDGMVVGVSWKLGSDSSGKGIQLLHMPCLPWEGDDKECGDVPGANTSHGTTKTGDDPDSRIDVSGHGCHGKASSPLSFQEYGKKGHTHFLPLLPCCSRMLIQIDCDADLPIIHHSHP
ncbi:hypothetical protein C2S51_014177 [Perilla frutescens var. frutescens]|nr:hypothetical protein C2S51_014177 [Perilla frutescens var. frutescens]